jgi:hypothetical protein
MLPTLLLPLWTNLNTLRRRQPTNSEDTRQSSPSGFCSTTENVMTSDLDGDLSDVPTGVNRENEPQESEHLKRYTEEEQSTYLTQEGNQGRLFIKGYLLPEEESATHGVKYEIKSHTTKIGDLVTRSQDGFWSSIFIKGQQFPTAELLLATVAKLDEDKAIYHTHIESIMSSIELNQVNDGTVMNAILRSVEPANASLYDKGGVLNEAELESLLHRHPFLERWSEVFRSSATRARNERQLNRNKEEFIKRFRTAVARNWVLQPSPSNLMTHGVCNELRNISKLLQLDLPTNDDIDTKIGRFEKSWVLFACAVNQSYIQALMSTSTKKFAILAKRHFESARKLLSSEEIIRELPDSELLRKWELIPGPHGILERDDVPHNRKQRFRDWEASNSRAVTRHIAPPDQRGQYFFIPIDNDQKAPQPETITKDSSREITPEATGKVDVPQGNHSTPSQQSATLIDEDQESSRPETITKDISHEITPEATGKIDVPQDDQEDTPTEVKNVSRKLFKQFSKQPMIRLHIQEDDELSRGNKRRKLRNALQWVKDEQAIYEVETERSLCSVGEGEERPCDEDIYEDWKLALSISDKSEAIGFLIDYLEYTETRGYHVCKVHHAQLGWRLQLRGKDRVEADKIFVELRDAVVTGKYDEYVWTNREYFLASSIPEIEEDKGRLSDEHMRGLKELFAPPGQTKLNTKLEESGAPFRIFTLLGLTDDKLLEILLGELAMQKYYEEDSFSGVYHSWIQQICRMDPYIYLLNVVSRVDGSYKFVQYIEQAIFTRLGPHIHRKSENDMPIEVYSPFLPASIAWGHEGAAVKHMTVTLDRDVDMSAIAIDLKSLADDDVECSDEDCEYGFAHGLPENPSFFYTGGQALLRSHGVGERFQRDIKKNCVVVFDTPTHASYAKKRLPKKTAQEQCSVLTRHGTHVIPLAAIKVEGEKTEVLTVDSIKAIADSSRKLQAPLRQLTGQLAKPTASRFLTRIIPPTALAAALLGQGDWAHPNVAKDLQLLLNRETRDIFIKCHRDNVAENVLRLFESIRQREYEVWEGKGWFRGETWQTAIGKDVEELNAAKEKDNAQESSTAAKIPEHSTVAKPPKRSTSKVRAGDRVPIVVGFSNEAQNEGGARLPICGAIHDKDGTPINPDEIEDYEDCLPIQYCLARACTMILKELNKDERELSDQEIDQVKMRAIEEVEARVDHREARGVPGEGHLVVEYEKMHNLENGIHHAESVRSGKSGPMPNWTITDPLARNFRLNRLDKEQMLAYAHWKVEHESGYPIESVKHKPSLHNAALRRWKVLGQELLDEYDLEE